MSYMTLTELQTSAVEILSEKDKQLSPSLEILLEMAYKLGQRDTYREVRESLNKNV